MEKKLTPKQKKFCELYLISGNATEAAKSAGYSQKTAYSIGQENLKKPVIQKYIEKRGAKAENNLIADADEVLRYLTRVMRREEKEHIVVVTKMKKSRYDNKGKKITEEKEMPEVVQIPSKLSDSNKAAEQLGKRLALWDGSGREHKSNGLLEALAEEMERRRDE